MDYRIKGARYLRKYRETNLSSVNAAAISAQKVVNSLCDIPWVRSPEYSAKLAFHNYEAKSGTASADINIDKEQETLDAALFCSEHADGMHRAYANAAVYVFQFPDSVAGAGISVSSLRCQVNTDYFNSKGVRLHVWTGPTLEIPMSCKTVRGEDQWGEVVEDGTTASGVAKRTVTTSSDGSETWFTTSETVTLAPSGGLTLQKYLFILVALESYGTTRGNWLEGSSCIDNDVVVTLGTEVPALDEYRLNDLSPRGAEVEFPVVTQGVTQSNFTALSGLYGIEVLGNGDDWADIPSKDVASISNQEAMVVSSGAAESLKSGSYSPDGVCWNMEIAHIGPPPESNLDEVLFGNYLLMYASSQFRDGADNANSGISRKVIKVINTATGAEKTIDLPLMTDADAASGVAFAYAGGYAANRSSDDDGGPTELQLNVYCGNGTKLTSYLYYNVDDGSSWHTSRFIDAESAEECHYRTAGVTIPVAAILEMPVFDRGGGRYEFTYHKMGHVGYPAVTVVVNVAGTVTHVRGCSRPAFSTVSGSNGLHALKKGMLVISGDLSSASAFGTTVQCRNCAIVSINVAENTQSLSVPEWDAAITPDTYENFKVTPVQPVLTSYSREIVDTDAFIVTGMFTRLGDIDAPGCAMVSSDGTVTPLRLSTSDGEADAVRNVLALADGRIFYQAGNVVHEKIYSHPDLLRCQAAVQVPARSSIGLRSLYAKFYLGRFKPVSVDDQYKRRRQGAGFTIEHDTRNGVGWYEDGGATGTMNVGILRMSASSMLIPFSVPIAFSADRVRVSLWQLNNLTASGGTLNFWLKRGAYVEELPDTVLRNPDIYIGESWSVDGWDLIGKVSGEAAQEMVGNNVDFTLDAPLTGRVASLLITGFIGQDDIAYLASGDIRGVGQLYVDTEKEAAGGTANLFRPDVKLVGTADEAV